MGSTKVSKSKQAICIALYDAQMISKALRYGRCVTMGSHSFTCHPHNKCQSSVEYSFYHVDQYYPLVLVMLWGCVCL